MYQYIPRARTFILARAFSSPFIGWWWFLLVVENCQLGREYAKCVTRTLPRRPKFGVVPIHFSRCSCLHLPHVTAHVFNASSASGLNSVQRYEWYVCMWRRSPVTLLFMERLCTVHRGCVSSWFIVYVMVRMMFEVWSGSFFFSTCIMLIRWECVFYCSRLT